jgi:2,3-diketo-5-methylthio-1-phosphopentane phosphatase
LISEFDLKQQAEACTPTKPNRSKVLVSDFDGTMTRHDFYKLAIERLLPRDVPDYWSQYRSGEITHFEALRLYFAAIRKSESQVLDVVRQMHLDDMLPQALMKLESAGWRVVIASAGCRWYMSHLLNSPDLQNRLEQQLEIHANPGRFVEGQGLLMEMPKESHYVSRELGIDKLGVVREFVNQGKTVAFAGDGFPDYEPARLVSGELRFARGDLARVLSDEGLPFHAFENWSEIAGYLCAIGNTTC